MKTLIRNPGKIHYMCLGKNIDDNEVLNFNELTVKSGKGVEILGIKIGNNLNFNNHIKSICRKGRSKVKRSSESFFQPQYDTKKVII